MSVMLHAVPILSDNYVWTLTDLTTKQTVIIDPGEAGPVLAYLDEHKLTLAGILITHHHWDHTNGIAELKAKFKVPVIGPKNDHIDTLTNQVIDGDEVTVPHFPLTFKVIGIGGHTLGHIAYYTEDMLFCGDTLFAAGCGRVFEGTAKEMYQSLQKLAQLPDSTKVCCAHEYTLNNLKFAETVEPDNVAIKNKKAKVSEQRAQGLITLPSVMNEEKETNPFLRCHLASVKEAVEKHTALSLNDEVSVFANLRKWKDHF